MAICMSSLGQNSLQKLARVLWIMGLIATPFLLYGLKTLVAPSTGTTDMQTDMNLYCLSPTKPAAWHQVNISTYSITMQCLDSFVLTSPKSPSTLSKNSSQTPPRSVTLFLTVLPEQGQQL